MITDDGSNSPTLNRLLSLFRFLDERIKIHFSETNQGIVATTNNSIAHAVGNYLVFIDHDDLITTDALSQVAQAIEKAPGAIYLYSDEDKLGTWGRKYDTFNKPDWSPERLRGQMYIGHLSVISRKKVLEVGCLNSDYEGSQDHELALRVTELDGEIVHIPRVLYHWRAGKNSTALSPEAKPYTWVAGLKAVNSQLTRLKIPAEAKFGPVPGTYQINRFFDPEELVSVIIPTRGTAGSVNDINRVFVVECINSIFASSPNSNIEVVVVHDLDTPDDVLLELNRSWPEKVKLIPYSGEFNFSKKCNLGFLNCSANKIVFLNDDMELVTQYFIHKLVAPLAEQNVGVTGAKLIYEDDTVQHAGLSVHNGEMWNISSGETRNAYGYFSSLLINREVTGVTGAALAVSRENFELVGGFSEILPGNFNDVDFCLKLISLGKQNLWLSDLISYHFESKSRVPTVYGYEHEMILSRWGKITRDRYLADNKFQF